jgi:gamma-glutamyltranspeptidase/glutathione hydrolase
MRTLRRGGSAADAFIAASAALAVVEPMNCGIGGDLFATIFEPAPPGSGRRGKVVGLNASGPLGSKVTREVIQDIIASIEYDKDPAYQDQPIPLNGAAAAITVPGAVGGWCALHAKHGKLPWQDLFQPAISLAMQGFNVSLHTWRNWNGLQEANRVRKSGQLTSQQYLDFMSVYAPGGITPLPGEFMRNPALGRTLSMIARGGCDEFYRGTIAKEMGEYMKSVGGLLTAADFAAYWPAPPTTVPTHSSHKAAAVDVYSSPSVEWVEPLCTTYKRGQYEVHGMPGNSQALAGLQMLSVLDEYDGAYLATHPLHRTYVLVALKRIVYTYDRALYGGDGPLPPGLAPATDAPGCKSRGESLRRVLGMTPAEIKAMIDESFHAGQPFPIERVAKYAAALRTARAGKTRESHKRWLMNDRVPQGAGDTVAMVVRDGSGLTISSLQSVCGSFGSKLVSPDLGFALQNRGTKFNLLDSVTHPNGLLPGRRPHHTLSPWIVTHADSGLPFLAAAMKGGDRQPYAFLQMFSNLVDLQMPLSHAIAAPRFRHVVHSEPTAHQPVSSFTSGLLRGAAGPSLESFTNTSIQVEGGYPLSGDDLVALKTTYGISVKTIKANYPFADSGFGICQALLVTYPAQQDEPQDQQAPSGAGSTKIAVTVEAAADAVRKPGLAIALDGPRLDDAAASKSSSSTSRHKTHGASLTKVWNIFG